MPQAQQDDWGRHCGKYKACGQPVYFVREDWVRGQYRQEHAHARERREQHDQHKLAVLSVPAAFLMGMSRSVVSTVIGREAAKK